MKTSAYSIGLILLLLPTAPAAHGKGRLAKAVTREAVRLAAVQSGGTSPEPNWVRVRGLAPGTVVVVTVRGSTPDRRRIVQADDFTLSVQSRSTQVIETIARGDVLEIRIEGKPSEGRRALGLLGGLGGAIGGAFAGAHLGGMV